MAKPDGSFTPATVKLILLRDSDRCALCGLVVTGLRGLDWSVHHRKPRGMGGTKDPAISSPANGVLTHGNGTQGCHSVIESERENYINAGFLINRNSRFLPWGVPIAHAVHGLVLLTHEGGVESWKEAA